jgi:hypothetical protein
MSDVPVPGKAERVIVDPTGLLPGDVIISLNDYDPHGCHCDVLVTAERAADPGGPVTFTLMFMRSTETFRLAFSNLPGAPLAPIGLRRIVAEMHSQTSLPKEAIRDAVLTARRDGSFTGPVREPG